MKIISITVAVVVIAVLAVTGFAHSGMYDVAASSSHGRMAQWFFSTTSHASIERRAHEITVPDLGEDSLVLAGINDFNSMCIGCHGAPGKGPEAMGLGLNPPAPDLAHSAEEMSPAELFWVTKHGIKMTGMPAWGATHDDESIWPVVAFMTRLPSLDESGYEEMLSSATGHGHHADDSASDEHAHAESTETTESNVHVHDDGTEHVHEAPAEVEPMDDHDDSTHEHDNR